VRFALYAPSPHLVVTTHLVTPYYVTLVRPTGIILPQGVFVDRIYDSSSSCSYFTAIKKKSRKFLIKSWLARNIMYIYICGYIGDVVVVGYGVCVCVCVCVCVLRRSIILYYTHLLYNTYIMIISKQTNCTYLPSRKFSLILIATLQSLNSTALPQGRKSF